MKSTENIEIKRKPRYDYAEARKLYEQHREALHVKDKSWLYRFVIPTALAILTGYFVYSYALINSTHLQGNPLIHGLVFMVMTLSVCSIGAHYVYERRCVTLLRHAQIDVPERVYIQELWRERKELRQRRLKNHKAWQVARFMLPVLICVATIALMYFLPGSTFAARPLTHQLAIIAVMCVVAGGYTAFEVEYHYLKRLWKLETLETGPLG